MRAASYGLRLPASASCLGRHSRLAGRCPNNSSLFPPLAAVVVVAAHKQRKEYFIFVDRENLRIFPVYFFTGGEPSQSSLRDASSPEGGAFCYLPVSNNKAPPSGELANECEPERVQSP